jgi:2-C-methyl-D-erythritol 2,4-cyclodiphosphate synthase
MSRIFMPAIYNINQTPAGSGMIGLGFDVHRLAEGESLVLGGITIDSIIGTVAHSDGDVILHALVDALLGALGLGDIGEHFPDTDPRWKGAESSVFVTHAMHLLRAEGYAPINVDCTLVLQSPKILDYKPAMRERIAELCGLPIQRVSVKATTSEHLGYAGRKEGVHAWVVAQVEPIVGSVLRKEQDSA